MRNIDKLTRDQKIEVMFDLINSFRVVKKPIETAVFLQELLTANEIRNLAIRLRIAKLLLGGKTHREIIDEVHTSLATVSKVRSWLEAGGEGMKNVISKLPLKYKIPEKLPRKPIEFQLPQLLLSLAQHGLAETQKSQIVQANKMLSKMSEKRALDRQLQKMFSQYYKEKKGKKL